jgi:cell division control protein 6
MGSATGSSQSLFRDETALTDSYTPDAPIGRDDLVDTVYSAVHPITHRKPPDNVALVGPPGTGKTTVVAHILDELEQDTRVTTATVNCWQYQTRPALLTELLIQLGYPAPRKGTPVDARLATLQELLDKSDGLVVALDEFDQCTHQAEIVYDLQAAAAQTENELGLILIANQPLTALTLDERSRSRFDHRTVPVRPYTAADLATILHDRVMNAFQRSTVTDAAIDRIAKVVADAGGDCRQAFTLLLRACRRAEQDQATEVTVDHVEQGQFRSPDL